MKLFVSGKIGAEADPAALMRLLQSYGHEVTFDWTTIPHLRPYEENAEASARAAALELAGVQDADVLVLVSHDRGVGMFVELGAALALGKPVVAVARPPARTMFFFHPLVSCVPGVDEVPAALDRIVVPARTPSGGDSGARSDDAGSTAER
jgi:hypothetical protein